MSKSVKHFLIVISYLRHVSHESMTYLQSAEIVFMSIFSVLGQSHSHKHISLLKAGQQAISLTQQSRHLINQVILLLSSDWSSRQPDESMTNTLYGLSTFCNFYRCFLSFCNFYLLFSCGCSFCLFIECHSYCSQLNSFLDTFGCKNYRSFLSKI